MEEKAVFRVFIVCLGACTCLAQSKEEEKLKKPTLDDFEAKLDRSIGLHRMATATAERLMTWCEVDRDSDDTKQLQAEFCGNLPRVNQAGQEAANIARYVLGHDELLKGVAEKTDLTARLKQATRLTNQLASERHQAAGRDGHDVSLCHAGNFCR